MEGARSCGETGGDEVNHSRAPASQGLSGALTMFLPHIDRPMFTNMKMNESPITQPPMLAAML